MTATPTKTSRQQLDDLLVRLEANAEQLLQADRWDECEIEFTVKLRWAFTVKAKEIYKKACVEWDCEGETFSKN